MSIKDLPSSGHNFRVSSGAGNFTKKLSDATRYGDLRNLADNKKSILGAVKKYEGAIKLGKFDRLRRLAAYNKIKRVEGEKLTKNDKEEIKAVLEHLGARPASERINRDSAAPASLKEKAIISNRIRRANVLSATRGYEEAQRLGSTSAARQMQIKAFEKLQKAGGFAGSNRVSSRGALSASPANPGAANPGTVRNLSRPEMFRRAA